MKVYAALQGTSYNQGINILGIFSSKEAAIKRCQEQPTYIWGTKWVEDHNFKNRWTNGESLFVKVEEYNVE